MSNPLSNTNFLTITASLVASAPAVNSFNVPCFLDSTGVVTQAQRTQHYTSLTGMTTAGFTTNSVAYLQASVAFAQAFPPPFVVVGAQDLSALQTIIVHSGSAGTGYATGDTFSIAHAGATGGVGRVVTQAGGIPSVIAITTAGTGYVVSTANTTTALTGTGTGLQVDITVIGETVLGAASAVRTADSSWYTLFAAGAVDADHQALATWAEAQSTPTWYNITTSEAAVLNGTAGNIALLLQAGTYQHTSIQYAETQSGLVPNNAYASLAQTTDFINRSSSISATATFKTVAGITPEASPFINQTQYQSLLAENCNVYATFQAGNWFSPGVMCGGWRMYERVGVDALVSDISARIFQVLLANPKIPQTNDGEQILINVVNAACELSVQRQFVARAAQWNGIAVTTLGLKTGDQLSKGYLVGAASFTTQSPSDRVALKGMPIAVVIGLAGSIENLAININVQA